MRSFVLFTLLTALRHVAAVNPTLHLLYNPFVKNITGGKYRVVPSPAWSYGCPLSTAAQCLHNFFLVALSVHYLQNVPGRPAMLPHMQKACMN